MSLSAKVVIKVVLVVCLHVLICLESAEHVQGGSRGV